MTVNISLREVRKNKGKTAQEMATELGYKSKVSYYNIENDEVEVTLSMAEKISKVLNEPIEKLFPKFFRQEVQENRTLIF
ncbi:helix-turn-helix transcriptional regulator [Desulfosporosinus sp. FKA]|uniref:helix-turn-helix transcriptional regulator n=1 Tax=Desulfosporosinus sp. FKA TaxID=1969834 RepID=UPI00155684DA|nr:helix-turn-helix transcriptional regulator [Desulfosporosinus sp. FKA]